LEPGSPSPEIEIRLRRLTLRGQIVGPDGQPVANALMLRHQREDEWRADPVQIRDGRFELPITDREGRYPLLFYAAAQSVGALVEVSGQQADAEPITVRLQPCGSARARFTDAQGKPLAGYRPSLWALLPPTEPFSNIAELNWAFGNDRQAGDAVWRGHARLKHYDSGPVTDADGVVHFSGLIPGAMHRLVLADPVADQRANQPPVPPVELNEKLKGAVKDFLIEPGKSADLGDITVKQPKRPMSPTEGPAGGFRPGYSIPRPTDIGGLP
jgi:hypothetical protein